MRYLLACLVGLTALSAAPAGYAQRTVVNQSAFVTSSDGFANLRARPSSRSPVTGRLTDGFFLVASCERGRAGRRWCYVIKWSDATDRSTGWVHESQFDYDAVGDMPDYSLEGHGVVEALRAYEAPATVLRVVSEDGYVNLRLGPGTNHRVVSRPSNGTTVHVFGCGPRTRRARWCLVQDLRSSRVGYVYDAELR